MIEETSDMIEKTSLIVVICLMLFCLADRCMEERKPDLLILPPPETNPPILLLHALLHNPATHNVHPGSRASPVRDLLRTRLHVLPQHPPVTKILPIPNPLSPLREHNVRHQVQRHDLRTLPARQRVRVGRHQENRPVFRVRFACICREGGEDTETKVGVWIGDVE